MNALPMYEAISPSSAPQRSSGPISFGLVGTHTSPPCGLARFTAGLAGALSAHGADVSLMTDPVLGEADIVILQHDVGWAGDEVVDIVAELRVPTIVVLHTIPEHPSEHQRVVLETVTATADHVVVLSEAARRRLHLTYRVARRKVSTIPHGATLPTVPRVKRPSRPTILTCGLLRPGKGIERVIDAMPSLRDVPGNPRYVVAGPMDPRIPAAEADGYRDARMEQARRLGVADSVSFDPRYYDNSALAELIQQASVLVLPFDSTEQVSSGVLADAFVHGRPMVATAFPHAVELLSSGAGIVVDHDDSVGLVAALRQIITQPRLAGSMAAEVRRCAPEQAWPSVAAAYIDLARSLTHGPHADRYRRGAETTELRD